MVGHPTLKVLPKLAPENDTPAVTGNQQLEMIGHPPVFKDTLENIYRICSIQTGTTKKWRIIRRQPKF